MFFCEILSNLSLICFLLFSCFPLISSHFSLLSSVFCLLSSIRSACIGSFIPRAKQESVVGLLELAWSFASFSFIIAAYILETEGIGTILYLFGIPALIVSCLLYWLIPSSLLVFEEYDRHNMREMIVDMLCTTTFISHFPTLFFLVSLALCISANAILVITLAPWLVQDYGLSITEFGYCTLVFAVSQLCSILFSYQFKARLGRGWSFLAGILIQFSMFVLLLLFNNYGVMAKHEDEDHYSLPLLLVLLVLCVHFIGLLGSFGSFVSCFGEIHAAAFFFAKKMNKNVREKLRKIVTKSHIKNFQNFSE